jgi:mono/diheme cytochrome c family protein
MLARPTFTIVLLLAPFIAGAEGAEPPEWTDVSMIFAERCVMCHSAVAGASKGLRLDNYAASLAGGKNGAVLVPGNIAGSELIRRLRGQSTPRMPFLSRPLPEDQIAIIERWIEAGLPEVGAGAE